MTVHKKLMDARIALHAMPLKKSGENKFANYKYFELGDFLPETLKLFHASNMCGIVTFEADKACLTITDLDDGTTVAITSPMAEAALKGAHAIQNLGAVQTYMRRYLWVTAMEIVENDILDLVHDKNAPPPKPQAPPPRPPAAAPRPPQKIEGKPGAWQLKVTLDHGGNLEDWLGVVGDACDLMLGMAQSRDDVMSIFRKNKELFDEVKKQDEDFFKKLMAKFTEAKGRLPEKAAEENASE